MPPAYRNVVVKSFDIQGRDTLVLCAHAERDVVTSTELARALKGIGPPAADGIIVVATVLTEEAKNLAISVGARVVTLRNTRWTDESAARR